MRFHKIEMVGKFILQKVDSLPTFNLERDQGRLVYNLNDNKVYQGSNAEWKLVDNGEIPTKNINVESPDEGKIAYYDGDLYYGDGSQWKIVGEGTSGDTNLSSYTNQYLSASSWIVNHNLDSYANLIQCWNTSHQAITPNSITQNSKNELTINFSSPQEGYVTVINVNDFTFVPPSGTPSTSQSGIFMGNSTSWNINHGFNTNYLIVDTWDDSGSLSEKNMSDNTIINDSNNLTVDWNGTVVDGHISVIAVDDDTGQFKANQSSNNQWNVNHALNSNQIVVQCWDGTGSLVHPNYIEKTDNNNLIVDFDGVNTNGSICIISSDMTITDGGTYFNSLSAASTWSINHSLNSQNLIVQVWSGNRVVNEYTTIINDNNNITINFDGSSVAGDVMIIKVS